MRALAMQAIIDAAAVAGLAAANVMDKPDKRSLLLPARRIEVEMMPQGIVRQPRLIAKLPGDNPLTHRKFRWRTHKLTLKVRAEIHGDDEAWLEQFGKDFIVAMPGKIADSGNNLVKIKPTQAIRGGYESRMVEVFTKRWMPVWITFEGGIYKDVEVPLITDVNFADGVSVQEGGQDG